MATTEHAFDGNGFCQIHDGYCSMAPAEPPAIPLDEALAPYLEQAAALRKAAEEAVLEDRLAELITADEPADGLDVFARRMVSAWTAEAESGPAGEVGV